MIGADTDGCTHSARAAKKKRMIGFSRSGRRRFCRRRYTVCDQRARAKNPVFWRYEKIKNELPSNGRFVRNLKSDVTFNA